MNANFKAPKAKPDPAYLEKVRSLPCVICNAWGYTQNSPTAAHHVICGRYGNRKTPDDMAIPLCEGHHQGDFDTSKLAIHRDRQEWVRWFGKDTDYIDVTRDMIAAQEAGV